MVKLVHISDLHCGEPGAGELLFAADAINGLKPDCIVVTGDLTHNGRREDYRKARAFLQALNAPVVGSPGNHDAPVFSPVLRLWRPDARYHALGLLSAWDSKDSHVSVRSFNSARAVQARPDWSQGVYDPAELGARSDHFAVGARHKIFACHHPPHAPPGMRLRLSTLRARETIASLEGPLLFLCGHVHAARCYAAFGRSDIVVSTAPTLASARLRDASSGFNVWRFDSDPWLQTWRLSQGAFQPDERTPLLAA